MKDISSAFLATEKVGKLMKKYAIPCIISLLVGALYNIVDQIFIANADYLGSNGNAANTVVFPLTADCARRPAVMIGDGPLSFCKHLPWEEQAAGRFKKRGELHSSDNYLKHGSHGHISGFCEPDSCYAWRDPRTRQVLRIPRFNISFGSHSGIPFYMFGQAMNPHHLVPTAAPNSQWSRTASPVRQSMSFSTPL